MSITSPDDRISEYNPVVATTDFPAIFPVFDNDDITVFVDGVERVDFAVTATYVEGISTNAKAVFSPGITGHVQVIGNRDPRRKNRFQSGAPLPIWAQNLALDTLEAEAQELARDRKRALKVPYGAAEQAVPTPTNGRVLGWNGVTLVNINPAEFLALAVTPEYLAQLFTLLLGTLPATSDPAVIATMDIDEIYWNGGQLTKVEP